jgi:hypothetical protein
MKFSLIGARSLENMDTFASSSHQAKFHYWCTILNDAKRVACSLSASGAPSSYSSSSYLASSSFALSYYMSNSSTFEIGRLGLG